MISSIDINMVRRLFDKANFSTKITDDGDILFIFNADSDFGHDVVCLVEVTNNTILDITGYALDLVSQNRVGDVLVRINEYNKNKPLLSAFLMENGTLAIRRREIIDEPVSEDFILNNFVKLMPPMIWEFFKDNFADF